MYADTLRFTASILILVFSFSVQAQNEFKPDGFAEFLIGSGLYDMAAEEYERLLFQDKANQKYLKQLIKCYGHSDTRKVIDERLGLYLVRDKDLIENYHDLLLRKGQIENADKLIIETQSLFSKDDLNRLSYEQAVAQGEWLQADAIFAQHGWPQYNGVQEKISSVKLKNPWLAAGLSTMLPGSGRVYAKDTTDGIISFLFVASFTFQAYRRFRNKGWDDVPGWIYSGLSFGFYISNIYGSYQSAKLYNRVNNEQVRQMALPIIAPLD